MCSLRGKSHAQGDQYHPSSSRDPLPPPIHTLVTELDGATIRITISRVYGSRGIGERGQHLSFLYVLLSLLLHYLGRDFSLFESSKL
jgi:hypothetical protein